jgi:hypothetical protein
MRIAISSPTNSAQLEKGCQIIKDFIQQNRLDGE